MKALLIVDIQNDFVPGGVLAVPGGDAIIPIINKIQDRFEIVIAAQDWHPPNHCSFVTQHSGKKQGQIVQVDGLDQILWPVHCVEDTPGAEFSPLLDMSRVSRVIQKGTDPYIDSYSVFFDNGRRKQTPLNAYLENKGVCDITICGFSTDYCVRYTAFDAIELGWSVSVVRDAVRGLNIKPGDTDRAIDDMIHAGVTVIESAKIVGAKG
jgi:nicotinamidase/pyrazinamidase